MNIVRYRQWPRHVAHQHAARQEEIRNLFDRFFDNGAANSPAEAAAQWMPRVDVREEAQRFVITADLPGIEPDQIEVQMDKGVLSIRGQRNSESADEAGRYSRIERRQGSFHRSFTLPDTADAEGISASGCNGVLEISIPKKAESTPRRIQVGNPSVQ